MRDALGVDAEAELIRSSRLLGGRVPSAITARVGSRESGVGMRRSTLDCGAPRRFGCSSRIRPNLSLAQRRRNNRSRGKSAADMAPRGTGLPEASKAMPSIALQGVLRTQEAPRCLALRRSILDCGAPRRFGCSSRIRPNLSLAQQRRNNRSRGKSAADMAPRGTGLPEASNVMRSIALQGVLRTQDGARYRKCR